MQFKCEDAIVVMLCLLITAVMPLPTSFNNHKEAVIKPTIEIYTRSPTVVKEFDRLTAIVKQIQPKIDTQVAKIIATAIIHTSISENVDYALITALIFSESSFDQMAESKIGAAGLMQICYGIWKNSVCLETVDKRKDIFGIENNITCGVKILKSYIDSSASIEDALVKYTGYREKNAKTRSIMIHARVIRNTTSCMEGGINK